MLESRADMPYVKRSPGKRTIVDNIIMPRISVLECPLDPLTMEETIRRICDAIDNDRFIQHVVINTAKLVNMQNDATLAHSVKSCDIINIDGMGVVFGARFLGHSVPERVTGIDLFQRLLVASSQKGYPVFLLGAKADVLEKATQTLRHQHPNLSIAGTHHGYFWDNEEAVIKKIYNSGAKLLFVAISSPQKECFIQKWKDRLGVNFVMGVGGTFDVIAGKVKRAPAWMQTLGLEWLFRLIQEPRRMWKRYLTTNIKFAWMLFLEKCTKN